MSEIINFGLLAFTSFFTLINPFGVMPIFMTMTAELDQQHWVATAKKATLVAIPMICGPGALTNSIVLMEDANSFQLKVVLIATILLVMLITYLILFSSSRIIKALGETGLNVMMRLMGLIVMVIAIEFFFSGLEPFVKKMINWFSIFNRKKFVLRKQRKKARSEY